MLSEEESEHLRKIGYSPIEINRVIKKIEENNSEVYHVEPNLTQDGRLEISFYYTGIEDTYDWNKKFCKRLEEETGLKKKLSFENKYDLKQAWHYFETSNENLDIKLVIME